MSQPTSTVVMAVVHRPCSSGVDLPPGASAEQLAPDDYHILELADVCIERAVVHRPNDFGIDLPAGSCASDLTPADYLPVEIGADDLP